MTSHDIGDVIQGKVDDFTRNAKTSVIIYRHFQISENFNFAV